MKKCYIVRGSEDGVIGAATNIKAAYALAYHYAKNNQSLKAIPSYQKVCQELKLYAYTEVGEQETFGCAFIERVPLISK